MTNCYLDTQDKALCYGCEACAQICPKSAITMVEDEEGFRYPRIDNMLCVHCGLCRKACPQAFPPERFKVEKYAWGGYHRDALIRDASTSGGAFSAIVNTWCDENYVIFGAYAEGLEVKHGYITDKSELPRFRKSKYSQSNVGSAYSDALRFLKEHKKVLFSGTPCHIAGLKNFLRHKHYDNLLTVEVVCEGVPSPLYIRNYDDYLTKKYGSGISSLDYRYTDSYRICTDGRVCKGKWDFQVMKVLLSNGKVVKRDRWFNPFWSLWLNHYMSRPSCYRCPFASVDRNADITLGDLWGVHIYCPDLYGKNGGSSLVVCNSEPGKSVWKKAKDCMVGREVQFSTALKYQGPMRGHIAESAQRETFMSDLKQLNYEEINKKWYFGPSLKLLWQKYIWGNRQKIWWWNLFRKKHKGL